MNREEILERIEQIRRELDRDQLRIMREKIEERKFHLHKSQRGRLKRILIEKMRKRLLLEISLILEPVLDNQKEINLRFMREIDSLKRMIASLGQTAEAQGGADAQDQKNLSGDEE